jgi:catechol 2,3-dioxygenase-like lactoylglutathione lyase family enzyme
MVDRHSDGIGMRQDGRMSTGPIESLNAITLMTADMAASVVFYDTLGLELAFGGPDASFTSMRIGRTAFLNLQLHEGWTPPAATWGRFIVWVDDVDAAHGRFIAAGYRPMMAPSDAVWGERYFHITDPAGHEVSVARRL